MDGRKITASVKFRVLYQAGGLKAVALLVAEAMVLRAGADNLYRGGSDAVIDSLWPDEAGAITERTRASIRRMLYRWGFRTGPQGWTVNPDALKDIDIEMPTKRQAQEAAAQTEGGPVSTSWACKVCGRTYDTWRRAQACSARDAVTRTPGALGKEVLRLVEGGVNNATAIAGELGLAQSTSNSALKRLVKKGLVKREKVRSANGRWMYEYVTVRRPSGRTKRYPGLEARLLGEFALEPWRTIEEYSVAVGASVTTTRSAMEYLIQSGMAERRQIKKNGGPSGEVRNTPRFVYGPTGALPEEPVTEAAPEPVVEPVTEAAPEPVVQPVTEVPAMGVEGEDVKLLKMANGTFVIVGDRLMKVVDA